MIRFTFYERKDLIVGFHVSGHACYDESGKDIVCAGVSSATYFTANALTEIKRLTPYLNVNENQIKLILKTKADAETAQDFLKAFYLHVTQLAEQYPEYITVENGGILSC